MGMTGFPDSSRREPAFTFRRNFSSPSRVARSAFVIPSFARESVRTKNASGDHPGHGSSISWANHAGTYQSLPSSDRA
jgi:hypothetical protein